jgi:group I intron endonuclease
MIKLIVYCAINGKKYIGYTSKGLEIRKSCHITSALNPKDSHHFHVFKCAIRKYGIDNFKWEILKEYEHLKDCLLGEKYFIKEVNTISPNGYNLTEGGTGGVPSIEIKEKISNSLKKYFEKNPYKSSLSHEERINVAKKAWKTKKKNNYKQPLLIHSMESKTKMSNTKNNKNKLSWFNAITNEKIELSMTKMSEYTGVSIGTFNHLKHGRQNITKSGWTYLP